MMRTILIVIQIVISMLEVWGCFWFLNNMLGSEEESRKEKIVKWISILVLGVAMGSNRIVGFFSTLMYMISIVWTMSAVYIMKHEKKLQIFGLINFYYTIITLLDFTLAFIAIELMKEKFLKNVYVSSLSWEKELIYILSRILILFCIYEAKKNEKVQKTIQECRYIILGMDMVLCFLLLRYQLALDDMAFGYRTIKGVGSSFSLLLLCIVIFFSFVFILKYQKINQERQTLLVKEQLMEERYQDMLRSRQAVHDMKNHLLVLKSYEQQQQWSALHTYLNRIGEDIWNDSNQVWTGNQMLDLILNQKKAESQQKDIDMHINTQVLEGIPFEEREIISLFGNLLDNAVEACERVLGKRKIDLKIIKKNSMFYVEVENSIGERPIEKNGHLVSQKEGTVIRGYGLKNVQNIVEKYDGIFSYQIREGSFWVSLSFYDGRDIS